MATTGLISVEEYLIKSYRPDRDFIDGETRERNMGEQPHALLQNIFGAIFHQHRKEWSVRALTEQRVQTSPTHYRIPDICIQRQTDPFDPIVRVPPLLCIEILSRGDSFRELQQRVDDSLEMGVEHVWAVDPWQRRGYLCSAKGFPSS